MRWVPLFDFSESYIALEVVLLISEGNSVDSLALQTPNKNTSIYLLIESSIDLISVGKLIDLITFVDELHRVETSVS
jgi:hypothetical protein